MSAKIMGLVFDLDLPRDEKFVLLAYADHADHSGGNIWPAIKTIMQKTGYSERSVQTITRSLEERGYLVPDGKGMKGTNKWRIPVQGGAIFAGVQNLRGAKNSIKGVQPTAPKPSLNRHINQPAEAEPKPDLVDGYMQAMKDSAPAVARREALLAKIDRLFGLSADGWDERVLRFIERSEDAGQPLEVFREWMRRDPFNSPKINRIASDKGRPIKDTWKAAFMAYAEAGKSDVPLYE